MDTGPDEKFMKNRTFNASKTDWLPCRLTIYRTIIIFNNSYMIIFRCVRADVQGDFVLLKVHQTLINIFRSVFIDNIVVIITQSKIPN